MSDIDFNQFPDCKENPYFFYLAINNRNTFVGCKTGTQIVFEGGFNQAKRPKSFRKRRQLGKWIPGDWGYIENLTRTANPKVWANGLAGENIIYVGNESFWGHFGDKNQFKRLKDGAENWFKYIRGWTGSDGTKGKPKLRDSVDFPRTGLILEK